MNMWDERFMDLAKHVAQWSKDPSTKVGAVIVDDLNRVVSVGFNGFPRGLDDNDRLTVHAEINAILFARSPINGRTLYVWPIPPCARCATQIIQAGIKKVAI